MKHLPVDTGMTFVLVQHLDPVHESALTKLLSKATTILGRVRESGHCVGRHENVYLRGFKASTDYTDSFMNQRDLWIAFTFEYY